jgi:hypothetical protein
VWAQVFYDDTRKARAQERFGPGSRLEGMRHRLADLLGGSHAAE